MPRMLLYCGFGVALLLAGSLTGRQLLEFPATNARDDQPREVAISVDGETIDAEPDTSVLADFASFASHSTTSANSDAAASTSDIGQAQNNGEPDPAVIALINRMFPEADSETAVIWADSFSGMSMEDIEFLLEQRKLTGSTFSSLVPSTLENLFAPELNRVGPAEGESPAGAIPLNVAAAILDHNLMNAHTPGFRRRLILPEPMNLHMDRTSLRSAFRATTSFTMEPGDVISSANPMHVALPASVPSQMFLLEDGRMTRRGDFQLLADRRIGLTFTTGDVALKGSPIVPADVSHVAINSRGEIVAGSSLAVLGQLIVVRIDDTIGLESGDGVFFRSAASTELVSADEIILQCQAIELSNVDAGRESQLRETLRSLSGD